MTTAIIGAGVMGETILAGLLRAGHAPAEVLVGEKRAERAAELTERHGVEVTDNRDAVSRADVVALVVKPQDLGSVLDEIADQVRPGQLVISLAAGLGTAFIESRLPEGTAVARVMPNTPALVDAGMHALAPGAHCSPDHLDLAESLLASTGRVTRVAESQMDAVTAVSGSGPAYVLLVIESMIEAGVHLGLSRQVSRELAVQTVLGTAQLLEGTGEHPAVLREQVTSPAGTTAAAVRALEDHGVRAAFLAAMEACRDRSRELAAGN